jgi:hypothetical protein
MSTELQTSKVFRNTWRNYYRSAGICLVAAFLLAGCGHQEGQGGKPRPVAGNLGAFRSEFNNTSDRSRVLVLLSPT